MLGAPAKAYTIFLPAECKLHGGRKKKAEIRNGKSAHKRYCMASRVELCFNQMHPDFPVSWVIRFQLVFLLLASKRIFTNSEKPHELKSPCSYLLCCTPGRDRVRFKFDKIYDSNKWKKGIYLRTRAMSSACDKLYTNNGCERNKRDNILKEI